MAESHSLRIVSAIHNLLGNEARLRIVLALHQRPTSVGDLGGIADISTSAVSQHLAKLKAASIVTFDRKAQTLTYRLEEPIHPVVAATIALLAGKG